MNGYGYQLYGELRYWHPLLAIENDVERERLTVYDGRDYMAGDVPRCDFDWADAGELSEIDTLPDDTGLQQTSIPGQGVSADVSGTIAPQPVSFFDTIDVWTPTEETEYDFTSSTPKYSLEIRDSSFNLIASIPNFLEGNLELKIGKPSTLEFTISDNDAALAYCTTDYYVVCRNARELIIDQFVILKTRRYRTGDAVYHQITCAGQMVLLERESIDFYTTPAVQVVDEETGIPEWSCTYDTVENVLQDLLDFQERSDIQIAELDSNIGSRNVIFSCEGCSVLSGIDQLQKHLPIDYRGHIWVDWEGKIHWIRDIETSIAAEFIVSEHIVDNSYEIDESEIITRVYMYGQEQPNGDRVSLPDPYYIEENTGTYGIRSVTKVDNRIKYVESLQAFAQRILDEYSSPRITFECDMINARINDQDAMDICIGTQYRIIDGADIDFTVAVYGITYNLANPQEISFDINNRPETLSDYFQDLYEQINPDPPDYDDPDWTMPEITDAIDEALSDPTSPGGSDLIDAINELIETQTSAGLRLAKFASLNADGDHINVYLWDSDISGGGGWEAETTSAKKPYELQMSFWNNQTLTDASGREIQYSVASGLDEEYQRNAVCITSGAEFERVEELQTPYTVDGLLILRTDKDDDLIDMNIAGRAYIPNAASIYEEGLEDSDENPTAPDPPGGTGSNVFIPNFFYAKFSSHNTDGTTMEVYLWNWVSNGWEASTTTVYKPLELRASYWDNQTITYSDSSQVAYNDTSLDIRYQRRAIWLEDSTYYTEVQEITPPYATSPPSPLYLFQDRFGNLVDMNNKGRAYAATGDPEEYY